MKVIVVGGGTSGWLTIGAFLRYYPQFDITLVESKSVPIIGVGESTTATFKHFINSHLKIDDQEFMVGTDAIYKMSVKFEDFYYVGDGGMHYPFGTAVLNGLGPLGLEAWDVVKSHNQELRSSDFNECMTPAYSLFTKNKYSENLNNEFDGYTPRIETAYHLNAPQLAVYLKNKYKDRIKYIQANVKDADMFEGSVASLILDDGSRLAGDLFVDCSGFRSILLSKKMNAKMVDLSHKLPNNKAWAVPINYSDVYSQMTPYTHSYALKNGWAWYTPVWSRIGNGYAYSDKYIDAENALQEFKDYLVNGKSPHCLSKKEVEDLPFFQLNMNAGYLEEPMIKNVVAVGLAGGFLEPLEGTGLYFVTESIINLMRILERRGLNQLVIDSYNSYMANLYKVWVDSTSFFYACTTRDDSDYWKEIKNKKFEPDITSNKFMYAHHGYQSFIKRAFVDSPELRGTYDLYASVSRGMDYITHASPVVMDRWEAWDNIDFSEHSKHFKAVFDERKNRWRKSAESAPHIYDYLLEKFHK